MKRSDGLSILCCATAVLLLGAAPALLASGSTKAADGAARKACIDPDTGELVDPATRAECTEALEPEAGGSADADADLESVPLDQGGEKVDLKGRFRQQGGAASGPSRGSARIAIINPATGRLAVGAEVQLLQQTPAARAGVEAVLDEIQRQAEEQARAPQLQAAELERGGEKVDLQGRFRSPMMAIVTEDGALVVSHE